MTTADLIRKIWNGYNALPKHEQASFRRCYGKTFAMLDLHSDGLMSFNKPGLAYLNELLSAIEREHKRQQATEQLADKIEGMLKAD